MKPSTLLLVLFTLLTGGLAAPSALAGGAGAPPGTTPVAGPVEVFVHVGSHTVTAGTAVVGDIAVVNSSDMVVRGGMQVVIRLADGSRMRLGLPHSLALDPNGTVLYQLFVPVPPDAALGGGTLVATAFVGGRSTGMQSRHVARDADTFEIVAP